MAHKQWRRKQFSSYMTTARTQKLTDAALKVGISQIVLAQFARQITALNKLIAGVRGPNGSVLAPPLSND